MPQREQTDQPSRSCGAHSCPGLLMRHHLRSALDGQAVNRTLRSRGVKFRVAEFVSQPVSLGLVQRALSEVGFGPSAASVEHVNGPTLPVISRSYVDTEFHGSLNSPVVNFADSNESLVRVSHFSSSGSNSTVMRQRPLGPHALNSFEIGNDSFGNKSVKQTDVSP